MHGCNERPHTAKTRVQTSASYPASLPPPESAYNVGERHVKTAAAVRVRIVLRDTSVLAARIPGHGTLTALNQPGPQLQRPSRLGRKRSTCKLAAEPRYLWLK